MNKQDLISKIKQLDGITQDERAYLINLVNTKKKYGLVWEDKPEDVEEQLRENLPVLKEVKEKAIVNGDEHPNHVLIEGDNLHALTALTFTHEGKIDVIYIDPPYNTGNKDFKYNDTFVDKEDSYRHSKWLSFIYKRLKIAKNLLSDTGVIFISIDDNENTQLKLLCDEIFGEANGIGPIIHNKINAKNDTLNIQKNHDYIYVYRKSVNVEDGKVLPTLVRNDFTTKEAYKEEDSYYFLNDSITTRGDGGILNSRSNLGHTFYYHPTLKDFVAICDYDTELAKISNEMSKIYKDDKSLLAKGYIPIRPPKVRGKLGAWTWSLTKVNEEKKNLIITGKKGSYTVKKRTFIDDESVYNSDGKYFININSPANSKSIIEYSTNEGTDILNEILGYEISFNNPKNMYMIKYLLELTLSKSAVILDFFAGSGTTIHATMALNAEDGGNRQCILVTNNENNICEDVTYERSRKVINGYETNKGIEVAGYENNNLRYYQNQFVASSKTEQNKRLLTNLSADLLSIKEDCYNKVTESADFSTTQCDVFTNNKGKYVIIVYHSRQIAAVCEQLIFYIKSLEITERIKIYAFSPEKETLLEDFQEVEDKIEAVPLPEAIYNAYRATFRTLQLDNKPMAKASAVGNDESDVELFNDLTEA